MAQEHDAYSWRAEGGKNEAEVRIFNQSIAEIERLRRETNLPTRELPIQGWEAAFKAALAEYDVISVEAPPGAGKSLDIGVWAVDQLNILRQDVRVAMTQPRRDAAQGVAIASAARHGLSFGSDICFSTSEFHGNRDKTKLQIQTTGVLINRFRRDPLLKDYDAVIIDEAHERDLNIDFSLGLLKRANRLRKEQGMSSLKIILASATLEQDKFRKFFDIDEEAIIRSEGKMYEVGQHFVEESDRFYEDPNTHEQKERPFTEVAARQIVKILKKTQDGDILVFMPGIRTINEVRSLVEDQIGRDVEILTLHSSNTQPERSYALSGSKNQKVRRVVISTNLAETSLTVPNIRYVVDGARKNEIHFDPDTGLEALMEVPATRAECTQRKGRAGRIQAGEYYSVLSEDQYNALEKNPIPEMVRLDMAGIVLQMIRLGIKDVENFEYVDPPKTENLQEAIYKLEMLGAITPERELTEVGEVMAGLPLEPRIARVVAGAIEERCVLEAVGVSCLIQKDNVFRRPRKNELQEAEKKIRDKRVYGDLKYDDELKSALGKICTAARQEKKLGFETLSFYDFPSFCVEYLLSEEGRTFCQEKQLDYATVESAARIFRDKLQERYTAMRREGKKIEVDPRDVREEANKVLRGKQKFLRENCTSDWVLAYRIFNRFLTAPNRRAFCEEYALDYEVLERGVSDFNRMTKELKRAHVTISSNNDERAFTRAILQGYAPDHLIVQEIGRNGVAYNRVDRGDRSIRINSASVAQKPKLAVVMSLNPGKGNITVGRGRREETEFKYAVGIHPLTSDVLHEAIPHRVRRGETAREMKLENGRVLTTFDYSFKTKGDRWASIPSAAIYERHGKTAAFLAREIVSESNIPLEVKENFFHLSENRKSANILAKLYHRSRGQINWISLSDWYTTQLRESASLEEAESWGEENYILRVEDICSASLLEKIENFSPERLRVRNHDYAIQYEYRPANPDGWLESERSEQFLATIDLTLPTDEETYRSLMSLTEEEVTEAKKQVGILKEEETLKLKIKVYYYEFEGDLKTLQGSIEEKYLEKKFSEWQKPAPQKINTEVLQPLVTVEELGVNPIEYAHTYKGEAVFAYPAITITQVYDSSLAGYRNEFFIDYFRLQEEAERVTLSAQESKQASDAKVQREQDRKNLTETARSLLSTFSSQIEALGMNYEQMGFSYSELRDLEEKYGKASRAMDEKYSPEIDPRLVIGLLWEISDALDQRRIELGKRRALLPEVEQLRDDIKLAVKDKLDPNSYPEYGMTYQEYCFIEQKWRDANNLLQGGSFPYKMMDPEGARVLFEEVKSLLAGKERQVDSELAAKLREMIYSKNAIAQLVTVEGARVIQVCSPRSGEERDPLHNPQSFSIGKSGRELLVSGNRFTQSWGGSDAVSFQLDDGLYVIGRDANSIMRVERGANGELKPIQRVDLDYSNVSRFGTSSSPTYASSGTPSASGGMGTLADLLSAEGKGKQEKFKKEAQSEKPKAPKPEIKEEDMTEEIRRDLLLDIEILRSALEESLKGLKRPTPQGKPTDKEKAMMALFENTGDFKRQLSDLEREINLPQARVVSLRGKIASVRGSLTSILNKNLEFLVEKYSRDWLGKYQGAIKGVQATIDTSAEALEFISEGMITREELGRKLKNKVKSTLSDLQRGLTLQPLGDLLEEVLGDI